MTNAKVNLIIWTIIFFIIWLVMLIVGFVINAKNIISNISFGVGIFLLIDPLILFFQSKSLKNKNVTKTDIKNYLLPEQINLLKKNQDLLNKKVKKNKYLYHLSFVFVYTTFFIGLAVILIL